MNANYRDYYECLKNSRAREQAALAAAQNEEARQRINGRLANIQSLIAEYQFNYGPQRSCGCL